MNVRWVDETDRAARETPWWRSPGLILIIAALLLVALITAGILINNRNADSGPLRGVTVSDLRSDPERYNGAELEMVGTAERVRTLPILDQYGLYSFEDETGSIWVLSNRGAPPAGQPVRITGSFNGALRLDDYLSTLVEDQLGPFAGVAVDALMPGIPLNVVFLQHEKYELLDAS